MTVSAPASGFRIAITARMGSFAIEVELEGDGTPLAIIGPNGAGKTTLLRVVAGAHRPERGHVAVAGRTLFDSSSALSLPPEGRGVGYVPQGYGLFPHLRVIDNVAFGLLGRSPRARHAQRVRKALEMLDTFDCAHLAERRPRELSGGEQQRVALARALIAEPALLLLDEPLAAMDATARRTLRGLLASHLKVQRRPSIVVTHDARDVLALDATICAMERGRVVQRGSAAELQHAPATDFIAEFFGVGASAPTRA